MSDDKLEQKEALIQTLNRRNTESVEAYLRKQDLVNAELHKRLDEMHASVITAYHRIAQLEQSLAVQRATSMGHGPTGR